MEFYNSTFFYTYHINLRESFTWNTLASQWYLINRVTSLKYWFSVAGLMGSLQTHSGGHLVVEMLVAPSAGDENN